MRNSTKHTSMHLMEVPERRNMSRKSPWRNNANNFPYLNERTLNCTSKKLLKIPNRINTNRLTNRDVTVKMLKDKKQILEYHGERRTLVTYKKSSIILIADFSSKTVEARRQWNDIFEVLGKELSAQNLMSSKTIFQKW